MTKARLLDGLGMEGDYHATGAATATGADKTRQLSLLLAEDRRWLDAYNGQGLCTGRFRENILLDGISPQAVVPGARFTIGEAVIEISAGVKHCFKECPLFSRGRQCVLAGRNLYAQVVKSGIVNTGDYIAEEGS